MGGKPNEIRSHTVIFNVPALNTGLYPRWVIKQPKEGRCKGGRKSFASASLYDIEPSVQNAAHDVDGAPGPYKTPTLTGVQE
jgi:hypothetical protein